MHHKLVYDNSTLCHIFNEELSEDSVRDHCHLGQPSYLAKLIEDDVLSRKLRSSASRQCTLKESGTVLCYGTRAFRQTAAKTSNSLPDDVRLADKLETFRSRLKTHLYRLSYC